MTNPLARIACILGFHAANSMALGSMMTRSGTRLIYRCKRCRRIYSGGRK